MHPTAPIKPTHKAIKAYYAALRSFGDQRVEHETAVRSAFQNLLHETARAHGFVLVPELGEKAAGHRVVPDGTVRDRNSLPRGYWEAKDSRDNLAAEIERKIARGYPLTNTIFEDTRRAVLYQGRERVLEADLSSPQQLADLLNRFYAHTEPNIADFEQAVEEFQQRVPELARGLKEKIDEAHHANTPFQAAFDQFFTLCQASLNPNISIAAVDEMLIQHLLTERLLRKVFDYEDFTKKNAVAVEVEKVVDALVSHSFSRQEFLRSLDRFYFAIEGAAHGLTDFAEKQHFLNSIYERFFQGYSVKVADTHGIVYTPQPIVDFMCASVVEVLQSEFGRRLGGPDVNILDPCVGTGNFLVNLMRRVAKRDLPRLYREHLFANEVMLLPYYIAALNIEHAYYELTGEYEPFEGLCFVDTLDLADVGQADMIKMISERNAERVNRQKRTPITVIIGNPPYNVGQLNENDNNKNRKYELIDRRIHETYARDSAATNKNALYDAYVKFFRWATDRLEGRDGIVCFISNNNFVDQMAFDGMRNHLLRDFTRIYHVDLHGNVRKNPKLSGTTHNVFGIQVGVGITVAVRKSGHKARRLHYHRVPESWRKTEKYEWLYDHDCIARVDWRQIEPDGRNAWLVPESADQFATLIPLGSKATKAAQAEDVRAIFKVFSGGVKTNRDQVVYDFNRDALVERVKQFIEDYNSEVDRFKRAPDDVNVDDFVRYEKIKWSRDLKLDLRRGKCAEFADGKVRVSLYRPFCKQYLFFDRILNEEVYVFPRIFPTSESEKDNRVICVPGVGGRIAWAAIIANCIPNLCLTSIDGFQCFPFYVYDEDGGNRRENITDWALEEFRKRYSSTGSEQAFSASSAPLRSKETPQRRGAESAEESGAEQRQITKWDIFYYVYGILHHPDYRAKFADCLRRELPRIPFAPDFWAFAEAGRKLAELHLDYEKIEPWPLRFVETPGLPLSYRVEDKMRLSKDKTALKVNRSLTLEGIPPECLEYRLGNRSALEWVVDQYQVGEDPRSGIRSDPNRADDPEYIVRLVGQVIRVSIETAKIVAALPDFGLLSPPA